MTASPKRVRPRNFRGAAVRWRAAGSSRPGVFRRVACLVEVATLALLAERARSRRGPRKLVAEMRQRGLQRSRRTASERAELQRMIRFVDSLFPSGPNCYRQALIEMGVDAGAASELLHMGLSSDGRPQSGHTWLASHGEPTRRYDAEFVI
jgi:hypothetical protein